MINAVCSDAWSGRIRSHHQERLAIVYVRQSTLHQVLENQESTRLQYALVDRASALGWSSERVLVIDEDLGKSGAESQNRNGFQRSVSQEANATQARQNDSYQGIEAGRCMPRYRMQPVCLPG